MNLPPPELTESAAPPSLPAQVPALNLAQTLKIAKFLIQLGHGLGFGLTPAGMTVDAVFAFLQSDGLKKLVQSFQSFHGLPTSGDLDPATMARMNLKRCALADVSSASSQCKWPNPKVTWSESVSFSSLTDAQIALIYAQAWKAWADVCGIQPSRATLVSPINVTAVSGSGASYGLDGPGGILAYSQLPCGVPQSATLNQVFDSSEAWTADMFLAVATHEIGHAIGIPHLGAGTLMNPYYTPGITAPTASDIAEAVYRYGPPQVAASPPQTPVATPVAPAVPLPASSGATFVVNVPEAGNYVLTLNMVKQS